MLELAALASIDSFLLESLRYSACYVFTPEMVGKTLLGVEWKVVLSCCTPATEGATFAIYL